MTQKKFVLKIILISLLWFNKSVAQTVDDKIDLEIKNRSLKEVFMAIERVTDMRFIYNEELVSAYKNINIRAKDRTVTSILNELLSHTSLQFLNQNNKIIISSKDNSRAEVKREIIQGRIFEEATNRPVENASVYFDGTLNGTVSDSTGSFTLYSQLNSKTPIIINAVGYLSETVADYPSGKRIIIYLKSKHYELDPVEIIVSDGMSRKKKLSQFRKEFLGSSVNGKRSQIQNENDIRLSYNAKSRTLNAFSDMPIVVDNQNLGYTFYFILQNFSASDSATRFYGPQFFRQIAVGTNLKKIEKARSAAYLGSRMHFIRSLWNDELAKNGFEIYGNNLLKNKVGYKDIVVSSGDKKYIRLKETLRIIYKGQVSYLYKKNKQNDILIDQEGYNDPIGLDWGGAIAAQRSADLLPLEYKPLE